MYEKQHDTEIVIKITPKNLERLIYILIILGLLIFSVVQFYKKMPNCPDTCDVVQDEANSNSNTSTTTITQTTPTVIETTTKEESTLNFSGKVEFSLKDVKLCIINETLDNGRFNTVTISINNGLDRMFNGRVDIYQWDENDDSALKLYPIQKIEKIKIIAGNSYTHTYTLTGGMFTELDVDKTVRAVLVDTDLAKSAGEQTKTGLLAKTDCP